MCSIGNWLKTLLNGWIYICLDFLIETKRVLKVHNLKNAYCAFSLNFSFWEDNKYLWRIVIRVVFVLCNCVSVKSLKVNSTCASNRSGNKLMVPIFISKHFASCVHFNFQWKLEQPCWLWQLTLLHIHLYFLLL